MGLDVRTMTPYMKTYYGVYGDDFVSYGKFMSSENPIEHEETLLKLFEDEEMHEVVDKHTFKFENNQVTYQRQVNEAQLDAELEHAIEESVMTPHID